MSGVLDHVLPDAIEAGAGNIAAEPDLITPRRLADESNFRQVRPRTAVRTAGRADDDFLSRQPDFAAKFFDAVNQAGQHAFGFRQRQPAGGQGRAGHRRRVQHARLIFGLHAMCRENRIDAGLVGIPRRWRE